MCALRGYCFTIGVELALATDVRFAADDTKLAQLEVKRGIYPFGGGTLRLPAVAGWGNAMKWLLTGDTFDAVEAHRIGLVQQVVAADAELAALDAAVDATAKQLLAGGPHAQREIKALFAQLEVGPVTPEVIELTAHTISRVRGTDEAREGFAAFLGKRPATWIPQG